MEQVKDAASGLELMKRIVQLAEAEGHFPDLTEETADSVSAVLSTHAVGALTQPTCGPTPPQRSGKHRFE